MSLQYIIDGYNIINHRLFPRNNKKAAQGPAALIYLIKSGKLCGSLKNEAVIVFDGYPAAGINISQLADSRMQIIFSRDASADDKIKRIAESTKDKRNTVIVSDDKEISLFTRHCGIKSMSAEDFIGKRAIIKPDDTKQELNYSQIAQINAELKKAWLE